MIQVCVGNRHQPNCFHQQAVLGEPRGPDVLAQIRERDAVWVADKTGPWTIAQADRHVLLAHIEAMETVVSEVVDQLAARYDDQWAVGAVLLSDLDDLRALLQSRP